MKLKNLMTGLALIPVLLYATQAAATVDPHSSLTSYEGSKTCRTCHESVVTDLTDNHAIHYRLLGQTQGVYDFLTNKTYPADLEKGKGNRY